MCHCVVVAPRDRAVAVMAFTVVDDLPRNPALKVSLPAVAALYAKG